MPFVTAIINKFVNRRHTKWLPLTLIFLYTFVIFWFGRLSAQIGMLEINSFLAIKNLVPSIEFPLILPSTYLMVLIMTKAENLELRNTIRQTWLRLSTKTPNLYIHKFVLGMDEVKNNHFIEEEMNKHSDLLLVNLTNESYKNLAKKTLMAFSSVSEQFKFSYLLKVDDDSFVRLGALLNALKDIEQHPLLYWGFLDGRAKPMRGGKWAENEWRLCDRYLPYQLGGGYILGQKLVNYIAKNAHLFQLYRNEDVSVGAWLAGLKVRYVHDPRFDTEWTSRGCNNEYLITHKKSMNEMQTLFKSLSSFGVLCYPSEYRLRPSYIYNFSKLPSECCTRRNGSKIP
ncbi:unnamed protein product [Meloidogyne enterolobii]|uniref:Uncharacterized protein n=1 Tax=Meloidogyne enterolobii TaxID=390850 RepID=A0ACB1A531_MELEN